MKYIPPKKIKPNNGDTKIIPHIGCPNCGK